MAMVLTPCQWSLEEADEGSRPSDSPTHQSVPFPTTQEVEDGPGNAPARTICLELRSLGSNRMAHLCHPSLT